MDDEIDSLNRELSGMNIELMVDFDAPTIYFLCPRYGPPNHKLATNKYNAFVRGAKTGNKLSQRVVTLITRFQLRGYELVTY